MPQHVAFITCEALSGMAGQASDVAGGLGVRRMREPDGFTPFSCETSLVQLCQQLVALETATACGTMWHHVAPRGTWELVRHGYLASAAAQLQVLPHLPSCDFT